MDLLNDCLDGGYQDSIPRRTRTFFNAAAFNRPGSGFQIICSPLVSPERIHSM
jgi:hypothetical protein